MLASSLSFFTPKWNLNGFECLISVMIFYLSHMKVKYHVMLAVAALPVLPPGDDDDISFSLVLSCFLNLALLFWNHTCNMKKKERVIN